MVSFPYYFHTIPISLGILMGIVWEAYHKGVPFLGVPENPTDFRSLLTKNKSNQTTQEPTNEGTNQHQNNKNNQMEGDEPRCLSWVFGWRIEVRFWKL